MAKGVFPDILKIGKITPVYKKDDKGDGATAEESDSDK